MSRLLHAGGAFVEPVPAQGGPTPRNHWAYWAPGVFWSGADPFPDAPVNTALDGTFEVIVGGDFIFGGSLLNHVATFSDGEFYDMGDFTNPGLDGPVFATESFLGDEIIGGDFLKASTTTVNHIVRWSDSSFVPLGTGTNGPVYAMVRNGPLLYVGGDFTTAGGVSAPGIATWNGSTWSAVDPSIDLRPIFALTQFDGDIIAGGPWVLTAPSGPLNRVAAWNGIEWQPLGHGIEDGEVLAFGALNGALFVGGTFNFAGGLPSWHIARWDPNVRAAGVTRER